MNGYKNYKQQQGDALVLSIFLLLLMTIGLFATMRVIKNDGQTAGALGWHTRGKQVAEVVLYQTITDIGAAANGSGLVSANWFRTGANNTVPTSAYWATCLNTTDTTKRCDKVTQPGFTVYRVMQETATTSSGSSSPCNPFGGKYYRIFLHAVESSNTGSQVDIEAIYRLCVYSSAP